MSELTEKEMEDKCHDISKLVEMYKIIVQYEKNELNLRETLIKIGDLAGGSQNSILFNYSDEERHYIRNKYGYIQRKTDDTTEPNENGIYFEKLYHLKIILEEKQEFEFADGESDRLKTDLTGLKEKIKYILHSEENFIQTKDDLVSLISPLNLKPEISDIITISKKYYDQHILRKIKYELNSFDSKNFDFNIREDRYYFARKCVIIGELLKEFMVDEIKKDTSNEFEPFSKIRGKLIHCHKVISTGVNERENDYNLNENIKKTVESMNNMIKVDNENNLFVNYADKETASSLKDNSQKLLTIFEGRKSDSNSALETNDPKVKQKKSDKNSPKSLLVMFNKTVELAENINLSTKNTTIFTNINAKYQDCFKKLSDSERNDYVDYPECLSLDNKEKIAKIAKEIKEAAKEKRKQHEIESKNTNSPDERELSSIVVKTLKKIDKELDYMTKVEQLKNIPTKKDYVIEHIISIIGQYQRELRDPKVAEVISQISSEIIEDASESAMNARNLGLAHNIFTFNPNELKQLIKRDILPAREHFKAMLTISDQRHGNIPESIRKLHELAQSFLTLGLFNKAIDYWKLIKKRSEIPQENFLEYNIEKARLTFDGLRLDVVSSDIYQILFGIEYFRFDADIKLATTYLILTNYEEAYEVLLPLTDKIRTANDSSLIKDLSTFDRYRLTLEIAIISFLTGLCFTYYGLFKEAVILLENAKKLSEDSEGSSPLCCEIKLYLAMCYFALHQHFEAKDLLEAILEQSDLHPIIEAKAMRLYTTLLLKIDERNLIGMKHEYIDKAKSISKNITNEKETVGNEYLNIQLDAMLMQLEIIIANSKLVHVGQDNRSLSDLQIELECIEKRSNQIISKIKGYLKDTGIIPLVYAHIGLCYSVVITDGKSKFDVEKPKFDKTKHYFDMVKKMYSERKFASSTLEQAFIIALQSASNACNNFAYFIEDIKSRIEYLEEAVHWLCLIFSSNLNLAPQQHKVFTNEKCLTIGNLGIEYHNLGIYCLNGLANYEKSFDNALKYYEKALSLFRLMLEIKENKIYITKRKDIEVLKSFALSYETAGFLQYKLSYIRKAMAFYDEALKEWGHSDSIIENQEHCKQILSCMRSAFKEIQNHLGTEAARNLDSFSIFEIELLYPEIDLYALSLYSNNLKEKLLIEHFEMQEKSIVLYLSKRNRTHLENHIKRELQFIDDIETRKFDEAKTFIFTYRNNSIEKNCDISPNDQTEQRLKVTNNVGIEYYNANDFDNAIQKYSECLQLLDKLPECSLHKKYKIVYTFNRARAHHKRGDLLAAICDYHATLKLNNAHEKASKYLNSCLNSTDFQPTTKEEEKENEQEQKFIRLLANGINISNMFSADKV